MRDLEGLGDLRIVGLGPVTEGHTGLLKLKGSMRDLLGFRI